MAQVAQTNEHNGYGFYYDTDDSVEIPRIPSTKIYHHTRNIYTQDDIRAKDKALKSRPIITFIYCAVQEPLKYICVGLFSCGLTAWVVWYLS